MKRFAFTLILTTVYAVPSTVWASGSDRNIEDAVPMQGVEEVVQSAVEECMDANAGTNFGRAAVEDWCEIEAWSQLGKHYPALAKIALAKERKLNEERGNANELREQLRRRDQRIEKLSVTIGKREAEIDRKVSRFKTALFVVGAIGVGFAGGFATAKLTNE